MVNDYYNIAIVILCIIIGFFMGRTRCEYLRLRAFISGYSAGWDDRDIRKRCIAIVPWDSGGGPGWRLWYNGGFRKVNDVKIKLEEKEETSE